MDVVYLVYGLAFLAMGLVILVRYEYNSRLQLGRMLWLLAGFGLTHGFREWMDLWRVVRGDSPGMAAARPVVLLLSFLFLFEFGRRLLGICLRHKVLKPWLIIPVLAAIGAGTWAADRWDLALDVWSRLLCGLPGAMMTGLGITFYFQRQVLPGLVASDARPVRFAAYGAGATFMAYAVLGGLVGPRTGWLPGSLINQDGFQALLGAPVQLFRAGCAVSASICVGLLLRVFHLETARNLESALADSQRSLTVLHTLTRQNECILGSMSEGVLGIDLLGVALFVNDSASRLLGYAREEMIGQSVHELSHHSRADGTAYPWEECPVRQSLRDHQARWVSDDLYWRKDGTSFAVEYNVAPLMVEHGVGGVVVTFHDITERRLAQAEIDRLANFQNNVLKAAGDAIIVIGADGLVSLFNAAAENLSGYSAAEVVGQRYLAGTPSAAADHRGILRLDGRSVLAPVLEQYSLAGIGEWTFLGKQGHGVPVVATLSPLADGAGRRMGWILAAQDISPIKALKDSLRRSNAELEQFTVVLAHHLQEPVRLQHLFAQNLVNDLPSPLPEAAQESLDFILSNATRMRRLIKDVRRYLEIEKLTQSTQRCDAAAALAVAITEAQTQLDGLGATVETLPLPWVFMKEDQLANVFEMLVDNAINYRHPDRPLRIRVRAETTGAETVLTVGDNGIGIARQYRERVFEVFERLHAGRHPGTGIGLAMVKKSVEAFGGRVWIEDGEDGGIDVRMALRAVPPQAHQTLESRRLAE